MQAGFGVDGGAGGIDQRAGAGEERLAAQSPFNGEVQPVLVQHGLQALLKALGRGFGAEAEVEVHDGFAGDDVGGARAGVQVAHLPGGGGKAVVACVPLRGGQLGQGGGQLVQGVAGQVGVGNVALHAAHGQAPGKRTPAAVFDHVARALHGGGFAHDAPVKPLAARLKLAAGGHGAVGGGAFFVAGEQQGHVQRRLRLCPEKFFGGDDEGGDGAFHVARAPGVELAAAHLRLERRAAPALGRAGGHHVGVARKNQRACGQGGGAPGPEVAHARAGGAAAHVFADKAQRFDALADEVHAARVIGRDGGAREQGLGQQQGG